jgi:Protein of unknown function (DUF3606)
VARRKDWKRLVLELHIRAAVAYSKWRNAMSARGRSQDRKRVPGGQDYEVRYEAKKTGESKSRVYRAVK